LTLEGMPTEMADVACIHYGEECSWITDHALAMEALRYQRVFFRDGLLGLGASDGGNTIFYTIRILT
jgi:hypothetical protein